MAKRRSKRSHRKVRRGARKASLWSKVVRAVKMKPSKKLGRAYRSCKKRGTVAKVVSCVNGKVR